MNNDVEKLNINELKKEFINLLDEVYPKINRMNDILAKLIQDDDKNIFILSKIRLTSFLTFFK